MQNEAQRLQNGKSWWKELLQLEELAQLEESGQLEELVQCEVYGEALAFTGDETQSAAGATPIFEIKPIFIDLSTKLSAGWNCWKDELFLNNLK